MTPAKQWNGVLELSGIVKSFGSFRVIDNVSLQVPSGSLCGLIGPNGAGKSTLFAVATGIMPLDQGVVCFEGRSITNLSPVKRARRGLARTFQVPREFKHLSVRQNLMVAAMDQSGDRLFHVYFRPGKVRREELELGKQVDSLIEFLGLQAVSTTAAGRLSGGQKKLLELGRALMLKPRLVLLDEPFAGVNPVMIQEICARIRELRKQGVSFLIVEHNLPILSALVDTMYVMDRGRVIGQGHPQEVLQEDSVRNAYLGGAAACF